MKTEIVHISEIKWGDTVICEDGYNRTVGKYDVERSLDGDWLFCGVLTIFSKHGPHMMERRLYKFWRNGKFMGYTAQP